MFIEWEEEFETGIPAIDHDHKTLVDLINEVHAVIQRGGAAREVEDVVERLTQYVAEHFEREERYMEAAGYAGLTAHIARHEDFTHQVGTLAREFDLDPDAVDLNALLEFLADWLTNHILKADKAYAPTVRAWLERNPETAQG